MKQKPSSRLKSWLFRESRFTARVGSRVRLRPYAIFSSRPPVVVVASDAGFFGGFFSALASDRDSHAELLIEQGGAVLLDKATPAEVIRFANYNGNDLQYAEVLITDGPLAGSSMWAVLYPEKADPLCVAKTAGAADVPRVIETRQSGQDGAAGPILGVNQNP